jgi:transcription elongation GreA/GreB family factor
VEDIPKVDLISVIKEDVLAKAKEKVQVKIVELEGIIDEVKSSLDSDTKSSAGDKHETSRAMVQLEQEKLYKQLAEFTQMKGVLNQLDPKIKHNKIGLGSLIHTSQGWYFLSVGIGQIFVYESLVFALNPQAPLGKQLIGKRVGEDVFFNGNTLEILEVY